MSHRTFLFIIMSFTITMIYFVAISNSQCNIEESAISSYWTYSNSLKPDGCIARSNISLVYIDHGGVSSTFWYLPRQGAKRACSNFGGMDCDITTTETYNKQEMGERIEGTIYRGENVYGIASSVVSSDHHDAFDAVDNEGLQIYSFNTGMDVFTSFHSKLFVGSNEYMSGFKACSRLKDVFNATKILIPDHHYGLHSSLIARELGCYDAMENQTTIVHTVATSLTASVTAIVAALKRDPSLDAVLGLSSTAEQYVHSLLVTTEDPLSTYNISKERLDAIVAVATFDYGTEIFAHILDPHAPTKFAIDQQPYLQGFLPLYWMGIEAATSNHLMFPATIYSGPAFIESAEKIALLQCITQDVIYCHDDEEQKLKISDECSCVEVASKTIYLFHHGGVSSGNSLSDFYTILANGAISAANDFNISLKIITSEPDVTSFNLPKYAQYIEQVLMDENVSNIDGIITTMPNEEIAHIFVDDARLSGAAIEIMGIADGFGIYRENVKLQQPIFVGMNDESAGYNISQLIYDKSDAANDTKTALLCIDSEFGALASLNERCSGVERYCDENLNNNIVYRKVSIDSYDVDAATLAINAVIDELDEIVIAGIVATNEPSCLAAQYSDFDSVLGCFDSSQTALDGLLANSVDFVFEQQPFLIGYTSVILMANKILMDGLPALELLIETGPQLITFGDKELIYTKQCENFYSGYEFCPDLMDAVIVNELEINHPTMTNFAGIITITLFIAAVLMGIALIAFMHRWRKHRMIRKSQPILIMITIFGGCMMLSSALFYLFYDRAINDVPSCNIPWIVWSVGFTLFFCSYALKVWRFVHLVEAITLDFKKHKVSTLTSRNPVLIRLFLVTSIDIIGCVVASVYTPFESESSTIELTTTNNNNNTIHRVTTSQCLYGSAFIWHYCIAFKVLMLFYAIYIAVKKQSSNEKLKKVKNVTTHEGSNITVGVYMVFISFLIFTLFGMISNELHSPSTQWILCSFLSFLCYATVLCCCMLHRVIYILNDHRSAAQEKKSEEETGITSFNSQENENVVISNDNSLLMRRAEFVISEFMEVIDQLKYSETTALQPLLRKVNNTILTTLHDASNYKNNHPEVTDINQSEHAPLHHFEMSSVTGANN